MTVHTESERFGTGKILHFGNIRARNESFARAGNDKAAKLRIMCDFGHFFIKAVKKRGIQRIECLGTVDGENADIAGFFIKKHEKNPPLPQFSFSTAIILHLKAKLNAF